LPQRQLSSSICNGARQGAPQTLQVADRFHLLKNVTDSLERFLARNHARLRQAAQASDPPVAPGAEVTETTEGTRPVAAHPPTQKEQEQQERRARRVARYEEVRALRAQGQSRRAIARLTGLNKRTVQRYVEADGCPEHQARARRHTQFERFIPYLQECWETGCHNAKQLWHDLRARGFTGGYTTVSDYLRISDGAHQKRPRATSSPDLTGGGGSAAVRSAGRDNGRPQGGATRPGRAFARPRRPGRPIGRARSRRHARRR